MTPSDVIAEYSKTKYIVETVEKWGAFMEREGRDPSTARVGVCLVGSQRGLEMPYPMLRAALKALREMRRILLFGGEAVGAIRSLVDEFAPKEE